MPYKFELIGTERKLGGELEKKQHERMKNATRQSSVFIRLRASASSVKSVRK